MIMNVDYVVVVVVVDVDIVVRQFHRADVPCWFSACVAFVIPGSNCGLEVTSCLSPFLHIYE